MTLPDERYRALRQVPDTLIELAFKPGPVKKRDLRRLVSILLKHYPSESEIDELARRCPRLLCKREVL